MRLVSGTAEGYTVRPSHVTRRYAGGLSGPAPRPGAAAGPSPGRGPPRKQGTLQLQPPQLHIGIDGHCEGSRGLSSHIVLGASELRLQVGPGRRARPTTQ